MLSYNNIVKRKTSFIHYYVYVYHVQIDYISKKKKVQADYISKEKKGKCPNGLH